MMSSLSCYKMFTWTLITLTFLITCASGYKYLIIPPDHHSNANFIAVAGGALKKAGHDVSFFSTQHLKKLADRHQLKHILYKPVNYVNPVTNTSMMIDSAEMNGIQKVWLMKEVMTIQTISCNFNNLIIT